MIWNPISARRLSVTAGTARCWLPTAPTRTGADWRIRFYLRKSLAWRPTSISFLAGFDGRRVSTATPDFNKQFRVPC
jgi:hypothetical protein